MYSIKLFSTWQAVALNSFLKGVLNLSLTLELELSHQRLMAKVQLNVKYKKSYLTINDFDKWDKI